MLATTSSRPLLAHHHGQRMLQHRLPLLSVPSASPYLSSASRARQFHRLSSLQSNNFKSRSDIFSQPRNRTFSSTASQLFSQTSANMVVNNIKNREEYNKAIAGPKLVLIDCFATWCGPCKAISPKVDSLSEEYGSEVDFYKVDVDDCPEIAQELGVRSMPTFVFFKGGERLEDVVGATAQPIILALNKHK
ncbi:thioredoxin [Arthroderma uncinatum]|uniref:thioredoxin n=1 Tax=Arthroderma uncinatum TaxID=74035 RepID=UPI00144AB9C5|nr:thioredoxin [Arthroderma uncinatum]KAF3483118.1 thioredoxin [Arthroderma uncinatum]